MSKKEKVKLVYLLAASHSGSTLTAMLLGAHPELTCVGELNAARLGDPERYLCSCMKKISDCSFWSSVSERMATEGEQFSITHAQTDLLSGADAYQARLLRPLVRAGLLERVRDVALGIWPAWRRNLARFQRRNYSFIKSVLAETGARMIVDSSKIGIRLKYLLRNPDIDVKVVWLVRDGRGVTLAYYNPSEFADSKDEKLRGGGVGKTFDVARDVEIGAHEWKRCNEEAMAVLGTLRDDQWIKVHYEDICTNTSETLDRVFDFLGVDKSRKVLDFRSVENHVVGNGMRLDSTSEITLDDRWKSTFNEAQLERFYQIAGTLNREMGYE